MTESGLSAATAAARGGQIEVLQHLLGASPELLTATDDEGETLLGHACRAATGDIAIPPDPGTPDQHAAVDLILEAGANPDMATADGWAPLHTAAMAGHVGLARRLLAKGADRRGRVFGAEGGSPLAVALFYAKTDVALVLASPPMPDNLRNAAALGQDLDRFVDGEKLRPEASMGLDFYGQFPWFPKWERTYSRQEILDEALTWAARNGQSGAMAQLLALGADVNGNPWRGTALLWAIYNDGLEAARFLLDQGADPNLRHDWGGLGHGVSACAIHLAAQFNCLRCLELLLSRGADPAIKDEAHGGDAMDWARYSGAEEAMAILRDGPA